MIQQGTPVIRSVGITGRKIQGIYQSGLEPTAQESIDCKGQYILPGMIDIHVHMRDLNQTAKEDYESGSRAAAAGGVTTVVDMPNSRPPVLDRDVLQEKIERARSMNIVNIGFYAGVPEDATSFDSEMVSDILGVKVYPHAPLTNTIYNSSRIKECLEISHRFSIPLLVHPDVPNDSTEPKTIEEFMKLHNCTKEALAVQRVVDAIHQVGGTLHVCHISCATAAEIVSKEKTQIPITGEVTPHHLFLNKEMFDFSDGTAKMLPPLRDPTNTKRLWTFLLQDNGIDTIGSDHAPHTMSEKKEAFLKASSGIPGLETSVPLLLTAVFEGKLPWETYLRACCQRPTEIVGIQGKGQLKPGFDADIVVVAQEEYKIEGSRFFSKAKVTPFEGTLVRARPVITITEGTIVYRDGDISVDPGTVGTVPVRNH
ncbi:MAG: dihydroorotase family protein [Candidatus Thorarchaeota archaeon]|nr:dihydroorotase family protein [Candidatus Thorarchaeota archaeon]